MAGPEYSARSKSHFDTSELKLLVLSPGLADVCPAAGPEWVSQEGLGMYACPEGKQEGMERGCESGLRGIAELGGQDWTHKAAVAEAWQSGGAGQE